MVLTLYDISATPFVRSLDNLYKILGKAQAHVASTAVEESTLTTSRLIDDMCDLSFQIQRLCDMAMCLAVFVAQTEPIRTEDSPATLIGMRERIAVTITVLRALNPEAVNAKEDKEVVMALPSGERKYSTGSDFVLTFLTPNFYFHYCTAYALLRKEGVLLGKGDYLGKA